jgi:subtilase family serine protease
VIQKKKTCPVLRINDKPHGFARLLRLAMRVPPEFLPPAEDVWAYEKVMESLLKMEDRNAPVGLLENAQWRRIKNVTFTALCSILFGAATALPATAANVELSPKVGKSTYLSPVNAGKQISVILALPLGDSAGAAEFVRQVSTPKDPLYRKYITPDEFAFRYGANANDYAALKQWALANGLTIAHEAEARTSLTVRGSVEQFQALFKTQLNNYRSADGKEFYSASVKPAVPDAIAGKVTGVIGLTNSVQYAPLAKVYKTFGEDAAQQPASPASPLHTDATGGTGPGGAYSASDLRTAYQIPHFGGLVPQTVAVFEQGGFFKYDVETYLKRMNLPHPAVTFVGVNGYDGYVYDFSVELEAVLDIDMVIAINPQVKEVIAYEDGNDPLGVALIDALDQVAQDNKAQILSISYGLDESEQGTDQMNAENTALIQLASQGITVLASAGDDGAYGQTGTDNYPATYNVSDPGSQPLITSVGGTSLSTGPGQVYVTESAWNRLGAGHGATGGGYSSYWSIPSWQPADSVSMNGGSSTYRNVPDVAAIGDPVTGVAVYSRPNGGWSQIGGTSVSAPVWAGYLSVVNSGLGYVGNTKIGFVNPFFYQDTEMYQILDGSNGNANIYGSPGYSAGSVYNNCCGTGSLWGGGLAYQIMTAGSSGTPPNQITGLTVNPTKTSVTVSWDQTRGATGYTVWIDLVKVLHGTLYHLTDVAQTYVTKNTSFVVKGLESNQVYDVIVGAVNQGGSTTVDLVFSTK